MTWDDLDNAEGLRPESVTLTLFADGVSTGKTAVVNAAGQWKATFADLPEYNDADSKVVYTVSAEAAGYVAACSGTNITMQLDLSGRTVDQTVTVVWNDNNNAEGKRPDQVTLQLYADGVAVEGKTLTVKASDGWTGTFTDLPEYNSQTRLPWAYTVGVQHVSGYSASYQQGTVTMIAGLNFRIDVQSGSSLTPFPD